jgi:hypothetical protein
VVGNRIDVLEEFHKQLEGADVDLLLEMVKVFAEQLGAEADALAQCVCLRTGDRAPKQISAPAFRMTLGALARYLPRLSGIRFL